MIYNLQIGDNSLRCGEMNEKVRKSLNLGYDPHKFFGGTPKILKTSFGYSFSGPTARKSLDHAPNPKGRKKFRPQNQNFLEKRGPHGVHKLDIMTRYHL